MHKVKSENQQKTGINKVNDFNYTDEGYVTKLPHHVRINKRPLTANPGEKFGNFT